MNPLEHIEDGIRNGNWETVCEGYEQLTGKTLPLPVKPITEKALHQQIVDILNTASAECQEIFRSRSDEIPIKIASKKKRVRRRPTKKSTITNDEEDTTLILDGPINTPVTQQTGGTQLITNDPSSKEIEDNKIKAAKAEQNKIKLNRQIPHMFSVTCNECEETFESDRPDGGYGQKCPKCLRTRKSRLT